MATTVGPMLEELVYRSGLQALKRAVGDDDLLNFPRRPNGSPMLLRQSFFERLLGGQLELVSFPASDIIAAQTDVRNLSLSQLLYIICGNLEFNAAAPSMRAQRDFLTTAEENLEKRVLARLSAEGGVAVPPEKAGEVMRLAVLTYGVFQHLPGNVKKVTRWLLRTGPLEVLLCLKECRLCSLEEAGEGPTLCYRSLSRASAAVPRAKRQLHWEVEVREDPKDFESAVASPVRRPRLSGARAPTTPSREPGALQVSPSATRDASGLKEASAAAMGEAASLRLKMADAEAQLEALRDECAAAKAAAEEANTRCEEAVAARTEAESARAVNVKELQTLRAELLASRQKLAEATATEESAKKEATAVGAKLAACKDAEVKLTFKVNALRTELTIAKEEATHAEAEATRLRSELAKLRQVSVSAGAAAAQAACGAAAAAEQEATSPKPEERSLLEDDFFSGDEGEAGSPARSRKAGTPGPGESSTRKAAKGAAKGVASPSPAVRATLEYEAEPAMAAEEAKGSASEAPEAGAPQGAAAALGQQAAGQEPAPKAPTGPGLGDREAPEAAAEPAPAGPQAGELPEAAAETAAPAGGEEAEEAEEAGAASPHATGKPQATAAEAAKVPEQSGVEVAEANPDVDDAPLAAKAVEAEPERRGDVAAALNEVELKAQA
mmetsp:Transcript_10838/g.33871  ORF Transcript_10838/g.33871 Transcript_10838/m.33871 type:complete len:668 (-) Transcript_10838:81-2084(-)